MTVALALLLGSALVGWLAPRRLVRLADPVVALVAWLASVVAVVVTVAAAMVLLVLPDHGFGVVAAAHHCWDSLRHGTAPAVEAVSGVIGATALAALLVRVTVVGRRTARRRALEGRRHLDVLRIAARREAGPHPTLWLEHDRPLAFSLAGRPGVVVATDGLHRHLTPAQVEAVLTHERAHLAGRHHLLVTIGDVVAATLPFLPLFKRAAIAVREFVELAADTAAVRAHGVENVRIALLRVAGHGAPGAALAMSRDAVETRLARLRQRRSTPSTVRRLLSCGLAGAAALVLPAIAGAGALTALMLLVCPAG
ncbi:M56 family metallopeptidase [Lentzea flava]|uniref:Peptidase M48 n=1 Tax=Lentzea flava TaxID=103732 RepID=A0ABQ2UED5_9PSEU|nr:M56 family metallopeptidase [Lentzea flava]MCP2198590.1 Zn-dependent protease with chaperone function [Lentzea flava]GGU26914.1 peptidase M48 [Lentzea flava]